MDHAEFFSFTETGFEFECLDDEQPQHEQEFEQHPHIQDIKAFLAAQELWEVPDSVLYLEPVETPCDLAACPESNEDAGALNAKGRKRGGRRHRGHFMKRPMALSEVVEELQHSDLRENALRCLSGHLIERREEDREFYRQAGFFLFYSCGTVAILLQEVMSIYERLYAGDLNVRGSKRLANVLTLIQSIAANDETRLQFVQACIPEYLMPFILSKYTEEIYENLRAISLSVIGIMCQSGENVIIKWALRSDVIESCFYAMDIGSELSKVIAMTILDSILRVDEGLSAMCEPSCDLLQKFISVCADMVSVLGVAQGFSPRLLFLIVRSYILLCQNRRALELLRDQLPTELQDTTFQDLKLEYPIFSYLRHQLLLNIGKARSYLPSVPGSLEPSPDNLLCCSDEKVNNSGSEVKPSPKTEFATPMRPIDFNKQDWCPSARSALLT